MLFDLRCGAAAEDQHAASLSHLISYFTKCRRTLRKAKTTGGAQVQALTPPPPSPGGQNV